MSRKTTFAVAALLSLAVAGSAFAQQGTKSDSTHKKATSSSTKGGKMGKSATKSDTGMKKSSKGMKKGMMKKDTTSKKP